MLAIRITGNQLRAGRALAARAHLSRRTLSKWEGSSNAAVDAMVAHLSRALDVLEAGRHPLRRSGVYFNGILNNRDPDFTVFKGTALFLRLVTASECPRPPLDKAICSRQRMSSRYCAWFANACWTRAYFWRETGTAAVRLVVRIPEDMADAEEV
jgi:hypothetical protein